MPMTLDQAPEIIWGIKSQHILHSHTLGDPYDDGLASSKTDRI